MSTRTSTENISTPRPVSTNKPPRYQTPYDRYMDPLANTVGESDTKQSHRDECDINMIMKRFENTGILPDLIKKDPVYGDFSDPIDYQEAQNVVAFANEQFASLSSKIRKRFGNDPEEFLEFATNPSNAEEMVSLGLATKVAPPATEAPKKPDPKPEPPKKNSPEPKGSDE